MEKATMSVQELALQMGISLPKAYALTRESGFPSVRIGTRILIPTAEFAQWLTRISKNETATRRILP